MNDIAKAVLTSAFCAARADFADAHREKERQAARAETAAKVCSEAGSKVAALREALVEHGIPEPAEIAGAASVREAFLGGAGLGLADCNQAAAASLQRQYAESAAMNARGQTVAPR